MAVKNVCYTVDIKIPELSREIETFFWDECVLLEKESPLNEPASSLLLKYRPINIQHVQLMLEIRRDICAEPQEITDAIEHLLANTSQKHPEFRA